MTIDYVAANPEKEFPLILLTTGRMDNKFYNNAGLVEQLQALNRGCIFYWDLRPHSGPFNGTPPNGLKGPPID